MNAVVFGAGEIGKNALSFLEKKWDILSVTDNDKNKWGSRLGKGYPVEPPDVIKQYNCDIIIASTAFRTEITKQVLKMGINADKIYLCARFQTDTSYEYEVYPFDEKKFTGAERPLIHYDLFHAKEHETDHRKILIFCSFYSTYVKQLIENVSKRYKDIEFSLLTAAKECKEKIAAGQLKHIYYFQSMTDLKDILEQLPVYDAMQLLWMEVIWVYFSGHIRSKTKRLNLNVGGSDFYRIGKEERDIRKRLIACADRVTAETEGTVSEFRKYYADEAGEKTDLLPFGIEVLDHINNNSDVSKDVIRRKYHIPVNKIIVTCGHNANEAHQHIKMIEVLEQLPEAVIQQIVCVFPMTYLQSWEGYIDSVADRLQRSKIDHVVLTEYMNFQEMAEYALISDIMIHVQTTDQLSSTMLEEMYAGSVVIAGRWLPYGSLHEMGMYFLDVDNISEVASVLEEVITDLEAYKKKCMVNKEIIWQHSSWDALAPRWRALWD